MNGSSPRRAPKRVWLIFALAVCLATLVFWALQQYSGTVLLTQSAGRAAVIAIISVIVATIAAFASRSARTGQLYNLTVVMCLVTGLSAAYLAFEVVRLSNFDDNLNDRLDTFEAPDGSSPDSARSAEESGRTARPEHAARIWSGSSAGCADLGVSFERWWTESKVEEIRQDSAGQCSFEAQANGISAEASLDDGELRVDLWLTEQGDN